MRKTMLILACLAATTLALAQDAAAPTPAPDAAPTPAASPAPAVAPAPAPAAAPVVAPAAAPAGAPLAGPVAPQVSSIKIVVGDKAKTDGEIRFEFTPAGGTAKSIRITVAAKMKDDDVARDVAKELKVALGPDYSVDRYDPDKIKVEAKKMGATFSLTIAALTANGLSVQLK